MNEEGAHVVHVVIISPYDYEVTPEVAKKAYEFIMHCEAVYLAAGWKSDPQCYNEFVYAGTAGKKILYTEEELLRFVDDILTDE